MMNQELREIMKRNNMVLYEYEDDETSNVNERYIYYDSKYNTYVVQTEDTVSICSSLTEARRARATILEAK